MICPSAAVTGTNQATMFGAKENRSMMPQGEQIYVRREDARQDGRDEAERAGVGEGAAGEGEAASDGDQQG